MKIYPDVSEIMAQKIRLRRHLAALPFEQKIAMLMRMQERRRLMKEAVPLKESDYPSDPDAQTRRDIDQ